MSRVFVSGCFDLLHSGHVAFLQQASQYGDLYVAIGSDVTVTQLKGRVPVCPEQERLYLVRSLKCVTEAFISQGNGRLDYEQHLRELRPEYFVVAHDGDHASKAALCQELGIQYVVIHRVTAPGMPIRSSTALRSERCDLPYRIEIAGGWLDQPQISKVCKGPVIVAGIEPSLPIFYGCGLASSSHQIACKLWKSQYPQGDVIQLSRFLFACENPPERAYLSGSQDAIGIMLPGVNALHYSGTCWPDRIESISDEGTLRWIEENIHLWPLSPRNANYHPILPNNPPPEFVRDLSKAAGDCWRAIQQRDVTLLGQAFSLTIHAQEKLFPGTMTTEFYHLQSQFADQVAGLKFTGAGGGGYVLMATDQPPQGAYSIRLIRR
jgi:cytidyltransferase-like protein